MTDNKFFPEVHGNLGFGCMRLPMKGDQVDYEQFIKMADAFVDAGFNYFDTAHGYISGKSETAIRDCVAKRYDRSRFLLANKLTESFFHSQEEIRPFIKQQLELCGVEYFDFYLMHAQNAKNYKQFKECKAYETCYGFKKEGLIRHFGLSFHDKASVLDMILTEHPEVEFVQIQFNYLDYNDDGVESRKCYDVCVKHNKPVVVMEPVKGGSLVKLSPEADQVLRELKGGSNASYAIRFAASFPQMSTILSGMSDMEQMLDNISYMKDFKPFTEEETSAVAKVCNIMKQQILVPCTGCRYCVEENECPMQIRIPDIFSAMNRNEAFHDGKPKEYYNKVLIANGNGKASDCIKCGMCEAVCPQHLPIRDLLEKAVETFE